VPVARWAPICRLCPTSTKRVKPGRAAGAQDQGMEARASEMLRNNADAAALCAFGLVCAGGER
jgi:hypothetical protein